MMRALRYLLLAGALALGSPRPAQAGFLVPVVTFLASGTFLAQLAWAGIGLGVTWAASKIQGNSTVGGAQLELSYSADEPQSLILGRAVTAGSLPYAESFGKRGSVDNSDLIRIIAVADHPCTAFVKAFADDQEIELTEQEGGDPEKFHGTDAGNRGLIVADREGKLAIKFYLGDQTAADALAVGALSAHPERPYGANRIGRNRTYVREHAVWDSDVLQTAVGWRFVVDGIPLYDPRKDSTVGGSGSHRFDDLSTHEFTTNLIVHAYNIVRGIRVKDASGTPRHFYGLRNVPAENVPLDNWFAAMNEADRLIDGKPQYHGGMEVKVNVAPLDTLKQIMRACDGRWSERGGIYKVFIGAPALPVLSFTDEDLRVNDGDELRPMLPQQQRVNYVTGKYMEPGDAWNPKVAPPRGNAAYEEEDGQRLSANLDLPLVQDDEHMERLQLQMLNRSRREIRHKVPLPPSCFGLEAGDIVAWTSSRNGYTAKLFEVDSNELFYNLNSAPALIEVDPSDHDWDKGTDYVAQPAVSLTVDRPAPKVITGFDVEAIKVTGDNGVEKPGLRISWDAPEDGDVNAVQWQYRRTSAPDDVAEGKTNDVAALQVLLVGGFSSLTSYDTRARLESFNGYAADWSLWATVTTPQCGETNLSVLTTEVNDLIAGGQKRLQDALQEAQQLIASLATGQDAANHLEAVETRRLLSVERDDRKASVEEVMTVAVGVDTALAAYEVTVNAHLGALDSSVSTNAGAITTLDSAFSSYQTTVNAHLGTLDSSVSTNASAIADINGNLAAKYALTVDANGNIAAMELIAGGSGSAVRFRSDIFEIAINGSPTGYAVFTVANVSGTPTVTIRGSVIADEFLVKRMIGDDQVDYDKLETGAAAALADAAHSTINVLSAWTSGLPADWRDVVSTTITTVTGDIEIFYYANHFTYLRNTTTGQRIVVQVRVLVDGVAAETFDLVTDEIASGKYYFDKPIFLPSFKTGLSAGSHTITIQSQRGFGTWGTADADNEFSAGRVRVNELRKAA